MSKNTNLSFLTDFLTADIVNSRVGMNNVSPQATFDVTGTGKFSGILTLGSTISNGTYTYTLPSATGTLALTSDIPSVSGYVPYTGATQAVNLGYNSLSASFLRVDGAGPTLGSYLGFKHSTNVTTGADGYTSIYTFGTNTIGFKSISGATTRDFSFSMASITPGISGGRIYTLPDADGTIALTSAIPANPIGGTGTSGTIPVFTGSTTIGNSIIQSNATQVNIVGNGSQLLFDSLGSAKDGGIQYVNSFELQINNSRGTGSVIYLGSANLDFHTNPSSNPDPRLRITSGGNVLINSTTDNGARLQVSGTATFSSSVSGTSIRSSAVGTFGFNTANDGEFQIYSDAGAGLVMAGRGVTYDMVITNKGGSDVIQIPTGTVNTNFVGSVTAGGQITGPSGSTEGKFNFIGYNNAYGGITANTGFNTNYNAVSIYSNFNSTRNGQGNTSNPSWILDLGGSIPDPDSFGIFRSPAGSFTFSNLFKVTSSGNVGIGTTDTQSFRLAVDGPNVSQGDVTTTIRVFDTTSATTGTGGGISFAGYFSGTSSIINTFSYIKGGKENSTAGNYASYLSFGTRVNGGSATERMRITSGGNVSIGTPTDTGYKLYVLGAVGVSSSVTANNYIANTEGLNVSGYGFLTQTVSGQMTILGHNLTANNSVANQVNVVNGGWYSSMIRMYYTEGITFHTSSTVYSAGAVYPMDATERVKIKVNGEVIFYNSIILRNGQINSLTSSDSGQSMYLNFQGNGAIYAGSSYTVLYAGSDERIKTEINHSQSTLTKILNLTPRTFKYKERPEITNYGFIAQEVEKIMPELVRTSEGITMCLDEQIENQKSVESYGLAWASILVKAIQEQQQQIQELKNKLS